MAEQGKTAGPQGPKAGGPKPAAPKPAAARPALTEAQKTEAQKEAAFLRRPTDGYLFVVTYGRSGSTLTQNLLNSIPGYCIRGENANALYHIVKLIDAFQREQNLQMRKDQLAGKGRFVPELGQPSDPWYGAELIDIDGTARRLLNVFCREILQIPPETRVAGFKEIRYLQDLNFMPRQLEIMQQFFPKARILFLTRDHAQVADSSWWRGHEKDNLMPRLARADAAFAAYAESHKNCFRLDYATYAEGPEGLRPLFDFLGEPMDVEKVAAVLGQRLTHGKHMKGPKG